MRASRLSEGEPFEPVGHTGVGPIRLQGGDRTPTENTTVVLSHYLPGAEAGLAEQTTETIYVVTAGELTFASDGVEVTLGHMDSVHFTPGTTRTVRNQSKLPASMLVIRTKA